MMNEIKLHQLRFNLIPIFILLIIAVLIILIFCPFGTVKITQATGNQVTGSIFVTNTCIPLISNSVSGINFGSISQNSFAATSNAENVINLGNSVSNIIVDGGNWVYGANNFLVGNTLWSLTYSSSAAIGTQLTSSVYGVDTQEIVGSGGATGTGGNTIYFGLNVPKGQAPGVYTETINIMLSC
jgi:hypothetical protein